VQKSFGPKMTAWVSDVWAFDPVAMTAPVEKVSVPAKFVETFLAVADFCLREDPLENKAVPTNRIKKLWAMVEGGAAWNQRYYQVVRERLHRMGIIRITDRHHDNGKAWRWEAGDVFPSTDYREEQRKCREKLRIGVGEAGSFRDLVSITNIVMNYKVHNTLYQDGERIWGLREESPEVRGPP
jgi:hypothetical protein